MNDPNVKSFSGGVRYNMVVLFEWAMSLVLGLPRFSICNRMKATFLRCVGAKIGDRVVIYPGVWIASGRNLEIGDDVDISMGVLMTTTGGVHIGDRSLIGYRSQVLSANHRITADGTPIRFSGHDSAPVFIGDDVWVGANCVILPGAHIGSGAVVAAGAVVTSRVEAGSIVGGVPARVLGSR